MLAAAATIRERGAFYLPLKDARMSLVDVRDTAAVAVSALSQNGHDGQIYEITGPESLSLANVAEILGRVLEKSIRYFDVPSQAAEAGMREAGMPAWNAASVAELWCFCHGSIFGSDQRCGINCWSPRRAI